MESNLRILKNQYVFSVISEVISILSAFIFTIFQARFLGAEIKGQVATINSITGVASVILGFGICHAYPYFRKNNSDDMCSVFAKIALCFLGTYMTIAIVLCFFADIDLKYMAVIIITPVKIYDQIITEVALVENPNKRNGVNNFVHIAELLFVIVLWLVTPASLYIGIMIILFEICSRCIILTWWLRKSIFKTKVTIAHLVIPLAKFSFFPMLSILMSSLNYRLDILMLNGRVPDASIGIYSIGVLLADRIWLVPDAMKGVMVSNITTKGKDYHEVAYVMRICNTLCLCMILGIIILGKPFIDLVFGHEYKGAYSITLILLLGIFPMIAHKIITAYNTVLGRQRVSLILLSISVLANVVMNWFFIPVWGIQGAGIASVISYGICSFLFIVDFCRQTNIAISALFLVNSTDIKKIRKSIAKSKC